MEPIPPGLAREVVVGLPNPVIAVDPESRIRQLNPAAARCFGWQSEEAAGYPLERLLPVAPETLGLAGGTPIPPAGLPLTLRAQSRTGTPFLIRLTGLVRANLTALVLDRPMPFAQATRSRDRLQGQAMEQLGDMVWMTDRSGIIQYANRDLVLDLAKRAIARGERAGQAVGLLALDLRQFRNINQSLGHGVGDAVLQAVGDRLRESLADADTVGRVGSDRFLVLLEGLAKATEARRIVERLLDRLQDPLEVAGQRFFLGAWCGLGTYPDDGSEATALLSHAETALGRARSERIKGPVFFSPERDHQAQKRHDLETELHRALAADQFRLHYQPQYRLADGALVGVEALIRWQHPRLGPVSPAEFVPLLEDTGLIHPVGEWILRTATAQAIQWDEAGVPPLRLGVNFSPEQFRHPELVPRVRQALADSGLSEERLELEITESLLLADPPDVRENLWTLSGMGLAIALDDFGTGYSALSYLQDFPIDVLKLDRSLIDGLEGHLARSPKLIQGVIQLARGLEVGVVAEGIETAAQARFLRSLGCDRGQGLGLVRPHPPEAIPALAGKPPPGGAL